MPTNDMVASLAASAQNVFGLSSYPSAPGLAKIQHGFFLLRFAQLQLGSSDRLV